MSAEITNQVISSEADVSGVKVSAGSVWICRPLMLRFLRLVSLENIFRGRVLNLLHVVAGSQVVVEPNVLAHERDAVGGAEQRSAVTPDTQRRLPVTCRKNTHRVVRAVSLSNAPAGTLDIRFRLKSLCSCAAG